MEIDMNNTTEPLNRNIPIEDMTFLPPDKEQETLILQELKQQRKKLFCHRLILSLCIAVIVSVGEIIARFNYSRPDTIPGMLFFVWFVFLLFNLISYISLMVKASMQHISDKCQCTLGIVTEKYGHKKQKAEQSIRPEQPGTIHLTGKTQDYIPNYILFKNDEGYCSTALLVKDRKTFQKIQAGNNILVIRQVSMGNITYDFILIS